MNDSIRLGSIFGIEIKLHWSMPLLLLVFWVGLAPSVTPQGAGMAAGLFNAALLLLALESIVLLHELGHSLVAKAYGLKVVDITFWPLGGMARMSQIPEDTRIEATIALAGPAVNFVLAALALPIAAIAGTTGLGALAWNFVWMNLLLGGFNLLPAFPMDGGRVLRALLARDGDWLRATERAVRIGRWVALGIVVLSLAAGMGNFLMLLFIAGFVWIAGQKELMAMRMRHTGTPFDLGGLGDALRRAAAGAGAGAPGAGPSSGFGGPGGAGAPFDVPLDDAEPREATARRPADARPRAQERGHGFSDEEIAELEGFHGKLRSFRRTDDD